MFQETPPIVDTSTQRSPSSSSSRNASSFVCERCWAGLFNTIRWEHACLGKLNEEFGQEAHVEYKLSARTIKSSADRACTFCSLLWEYINDRTEAYEDDAEYTVVLCQTTFDASSPAGNNTWYFSLHGENMSKHGGWSQTVSAYTNSHDEAAKLITARPLQREVFSNTAQLEMRGWMLDCKSHEHCSEHTHAGDTPLPTRVIDVCPDDNPERLRLVCSEGLRGQYATLSYCWGAVQQPWLTKSNLSQYLQHLDIEELPQTIQDAIAVARAISIRYLWIDSLAILQDDPDDKITELARMEEIYRNSHVAIVAASSMGVFDGFLQPRHKIMNESTCVLDTRDSWTLPFRLSEDHFGTMSLTCIDCKTEYDEDNEPINQRAWTLQEQLLPSRLLIFSSHTLQWRCKTTMRNLGDSSHYEYRGMEELWASSLRRLSKPTESRLDALRRWLKIVGKYSIRQMSQPHDKMPALAGIAKQFTKDLGSYHAGIWEYGFLWQLRWTTSKHESGAATSAKHYRAPSWSWASLDGLIYTDYDCVDDFLEENKPLCELVSVETTPKNLKTPLGEITQGRVVLRGKARRGWLVPSKRFSWGPRTVVWFSGQDETKETALAKYDDWERSDDLLRETNEEEWYNAPTPWMDAQYDVWGNHPPLKVTCLPLYESFGLLLEQTEGGTYKRVGSCEGVKWCADFEHIEPEELVVV